MSAYFLVAWLKYFCFWFALSALCCFSPPNSLTGPKSSSVSSRAASWRITRSAHQQSSCWSTPSSETSPTSGRSAYSSKTTSTGRRKRGARKVRVLLDHHERLEKCRMRKLWVTGFCPCADETEYEYSGSEEEEEDPPEQEGEPRYVLHL